MKNEETAKARRGMKEDLYLRHYRPVALRALFSARLHDSRAADLAMREVANARVRSILESSLAMAWGISCST